MPRARGTGKRIGTSRAVLFALQRELLTEYAYSTITEAQFVALAKRLAQERSGFTTSYLARLDEFFEQWLHGRKRPSLTPTAFFQTLEPLLAIRPINPTELEITWRLNNAPFFLEQSEDLNGVVWSRVERAPVISNGWAAITLERSPGSRFYRLQKE
jgi:hypothetical protein